VTDAPDTPDPAAPTAPDGAPDAAAAPATPAVETGTSEAPFPAPLPTLDDIVAQLEDGDAILRQGKGWGVIRRGEYGYGNSPVEAHANIGAVQLNGELHRRDGSVVKL
jgi:hypothetical protein